MAMETLARWLNKGGEHVFAYIFAKGSFLASQDTAIRLGSAALAAESIQLKRTRGQMDSAAGQRHGRPPTPEIGVFRREVHWNITGFISGR